MSARPAAWIRGHVSHTPDGKEYDEEVVPGSDQPPGDRWVPLYTSASRADARACTCHPDDNPPRPCPQKYALAECRRAAHEPQPSASKEKVDSEPATDWQQIACERTADVARADAQIDRLQQYVGLLERQNQEQSQTISEMQRSTPLHGGGGASNEPRTLPEVAGNSLPTTLAQFEQRCKVLLADEQEKPSPDNALIGVLCDAVRLARENERMAKAGITPPPLPEWQSIATAPKDGTRILLAANVHAFNGKPRIGSGCYSTGPYINQDDEVIGAAEGFKGDEDDCIPSNQECFTHWAPIPAFTLTKSAESP